MKNILITMNETPYPPYSGRKVDFFYKLKVLKELGYNIYLIYSYSNEEDNQLFKKISNQYVAKFVSYPRKKSLKSVLSLIPYFIISNAPNIDEKKQIDNMLKGIKIDIILVDHLDSFLLGEYVTFKYPHAKSIHRMHNDETVFLYSVFKTFKVISPKKWLFGLDALKMKFYENRCYQKYKNISAISMIEADNLKAKYPNKNIKWIPPFFDFNESEEILLDENEERFYFKLKEKLFAKKVLLLTGSFNGGFNVNSTKWFIENIFKRLLQKNRKLVFIIAGFDSDKHFDESENILVISKYESVKPLMKIADLSIIMATGKGGVKLKLMEALNYRKKIVSTIDGVYGSGFEKLIPNTDDKELFFHYCVDALDEKIDYQKAYIYFKSKFNCKKNGLEMINE
jgi:hypothetical protein